MGKEMLFIDGISFDPRFNLAMEQFVFDGLDRNYEYLILWQNDNSIIIGKHQNPRLEINEKYVLERGIKVVRRLSGGGAVYHDLGNLNFTFIVDLDENKAFDFGRFCVPVINALKSVGVEAELNGRNDITINGRKFSGNAQYSKENRQMHHGTIMFDCDSGVMQNALNPHDDKLIGKGVKSVKSRVTNISEHLKGEVSFESFKKKLVEQTLGANYSEYKFSDEDIRNIESIRDQRYALDSWNTGKYPVYNTYVENRFEGCGKIQVYMDVIDGTIGRVSISGDFFGDGDIDEIGTKLIGVKLRKESIARALGDMDMGLFFHNVTNGQFIDLLTR